MKILILNLALQFHNKIKMNRCHNYFKITKIEKILLKKSRLISKQIIIQNQEDLIINLML